MKQIDRIHTDRPFLGSRRIVDALEGYGHQVNRKRVRRLMQKMGVFAIYPGPKTSKPHPKHKIYPYLLRNLRIDRANQVSASDITYLPMEKGFIYLTVIMDWHNRRVLSWRLSNSLDSSFCIDALEEAIHRFGRPKIFNTDQGSQYTSSDHTDLLLKHDIKISMDGKGRATDNIAIERFWRSAKYENIYIQEFKTIKEIKCSMNEYIYFYNNNRFHQTLNYQKPADVYNNSIAEQLRRVA